MLRRGLLTALLLALTGVAGPRAASAGPKTVVRNEPLAAALQTRIRKAIEKGVAYQRAEPLMEVPEGADGELQERLERVRFEEAAAVTWALRRAGLPAAHADLAPAWKVLHTRAPRTATEASLVLLALGSQPLGDGDLTQLPETPEPSGSAPASTLRTEDRAMAAAALKFLLGAQSRERTDLGRAFDDAGGWSGSADPANKSVDVGGTYLALLGLESAARAGLKVSPDVFSDALSLLLGWQAPKGPTTSLRLNEVRGAERTEWTVAAKARGYGFAGSLSDEPRGNETAGAALGLTICHDFLQGHDEYPPERQRKTREAIQDALAWMQTNFSVTKCPSKERSSAERKDTAELYHHEWLQAMARLCIHLRMRFLGSHDWYKEGAEFLLGKQAADGSWGVIWWEHCYALLFLMRASIPSLAPVITPGDDVPAAK